VKPLVFAEIRAGDALSAEALAFAPNDRRRLAGAMRQLCPELIEKEAEQLAQVPAEGAPIRLEVAFLKELIERELPKLRDRCGEGGAESWDEPGDVYPDEEAQTPPTRS